MSEATAIDRDAATREVLDHVTAQPCGDDRFQALGPDWFGDRVFGGIVVAQALSAAVQTTERPPHSLHGYFLRPQVPGPVDIAVHRVRDGRTFSTRRVVVLQEGKDLFDVTVSFHGGDEGETYQSPMPDVPRPDDIPDLGWGPPPIEVRDVGPLQRPDGSYASTRRVWMRSGVLSDADHDHLCLAAFMSDLTGSSFRPRSLDAWGTHADASIDHAVWFHRPFRADRWIHADFNALINEAGRASLRGTMYTEGGDLCLSMAQELLIRPL